MEASGLHFGGQFSNIPAKGGRVPKGSKWQPMTPEQFDATVAFVRSVSPDVHIDAIRKSPDDPETFGILTFGLDDAPKTLKAAQRADTLLKSILNAFGLEGVYGYSE